MSKIKKLLIYLLVFITLFSVTATAFAESEDSFEDTATILFTHDLHSHFLPVKSEDMGESGGYARLFTLLEEYRNNSDGPVLTLDAGDFSMGSFFQTIYATDAAELRILGDLGFDATTFGNHEFDFRMKGITDMLNVAVDSGDKLPEILCANYWPPVKGEEGYNEECDAATEAYERAGVKEYTLIERDGITFAVFGVIGPDSHSNAPMSGMAYEDYIEASKRVVTEINANEEYDYLIALSHSGTVEDDIEASEDWALAEAVPDIDLIISGHTHSAYDEPIQCGNTFIVSCGEYSSNLGVVELSKDGEDNAKILNYELIEVDETIEENAHISSIVDDYKDIVTEHYLTDYGFEYDEVIAHSSFDFDEVYGEQADKAIGNIISDSYIHAVKEAEGEEYETVDFALNAAGVIRGTFIKGDITTADAFNVLSLGVGADGTPGYPLVSFYLYGSELKNGLEVDASVVPLMPAAQLYITGAHWEYNKARMIFNKITDTKQILENGEMTEIEDDRLYRVVTGLYCCQMLSTVKDKSFGILEITPRHEDGSIVTDYDSLIVHDREGNEVKEWYALASYINSFEKNENGVSEIPDKYSAPAGYKVVINSYNPVELLKEANIFTYIVLALILIIVLTIILVIRSIVKRRRKKKAAV